ncbi:MAG: ADP-ribosylglycohydrolase family protein [Bacteroidales bacterium]|nr:ADP-ribosylglycohydrolase family protein [Bacteroidales bacterium]
MTHEKLKDKIRGSLVGGAIGDAFGYPVEFVSSFEEIRAKYDDNGIVEYDLSYPWLEETFDKALFSDDTQMTLYTAEGLFESEKTGVPLIPTICNAYLAWMGPQIGKKVKISYKSELAQIKELNERRAPGNTCLTSLFSIYSDKEPMNDSKGCGGVMRVAPIGLYGAAHGWPLKKTAKIAGETAELTHLHPLSTYSSAMLAVLCQIFCTAECVTKSTINESVKLTFGVLDLIYGADAPDMDDFKKIIRKAIQLEDNLLQDWEVIENELGEGWVAEETLAIALFSIIRHIDDFKAAMICAVNHGGDSDSTGAVAGNLIGAICGYEGIPDYFKDNIQLKDLLISTADRLSDK